MNKNEIKDSRDLVREFESNEPDFLEIDTFRNNFYTTFYKALNFNIEELILEDRRTSSTKVVPVLEQIYKNYLNAINELSNIKSLLKEKSFQMMTAFDGCEISYKGAYKKRDGEYSPIFTFIEHLKDEYAKEKNKQLLSVEKKPEKTTVIESSQTLAKILFEKNQLEQEMDSIKLKYNELVDVIRSTNDIQTIKKYVNEIKGENING